MPATKTEVSLQENQLERVNSSHNVQSFIQWELIPFLDYIPISNTQT